MPNQVAVNDRIQVRIWCSDSEQASVNTVYLFVQALSSAGVTDEDIALAFDAAVAPDMKALIVSGGPTYNGVQVRIANLVPLPVPAVSTVHAGVGTGGAPGLPRQTAGLLSLRTDLAGPAFRGRLYLPFPDATHNTNQGVPTGGYLGNVLALANAIDSFNTVTSGGSVATLDWVVYSRKHNSSVAITSFHADAAWATMKKRGSFGRPNSSPI